MATLRLPARAPSATEISVGRYLVAFLLPLTSLLQVQVVGTLFLHDFLTPIVLFVLIISSGKVSLRPLRTVGWLLALWFASQVFTDLIQNSAFEDFSRGWLRILLLGMNVVMLWMLSKGGLAVLATYLAGTGVALVLTPLFSNDESVIYESWKFGIGIGLAMIAAVVGDTKQARRSLGEFAPSFMLGVLALVSLWNNSRSLFATLSLAAVYFGIAKVVSANPRLRSRVNPINFTSIALAGLLSTQLLTSAYEHAAASGVLGEAASQKYNLQGGGDVNLLLGGRPELLVSLQAIYDSPIIGHGSWARDPYYVVLLVQRMQELGLSSDLRQVLDSGYGSVIPSHSHLFGAWVDAGIGGAPIWIWTIVISIAALYRQLKVGGSPSAAVVLTAFFMFWDVLFSPFGASARFLRAVQICILIVATRSLRMAALPTPVLSTVPVSVGRLVTRARPRMQPPGPQRRPRRPVR